jgi:small subunit ribosomal protein S19
MAKEFTFKGKTLEELKKMDTKEFSKLVNARARRTLLRGLNDGERKFFEKLDKVLKSGEQKKAIRTHERSIVIVPKLIGVEVAIYNGKEFKKIKITEEMLGHYLGEFSGTRALGSHGQPGVGASRSSKFIPIK